MSSVGNIVCTRLLKTNKEWTETESKNPTMSHRNKNSNAISPFLKKVACVCKTNLEGFDLFRTQSCFHMLHREILSSTLILHTRVIPSDSTKPWVQISEHLAHPSQGTFFYSFWECWPGGKKDNKRLQFSPEKTLLVHSGHTSCSCLRSLLWPITMRSFPWTHICGVGRLGLHRLCRNHSRSLGSSPGA